MSVQIARNDKDADMIDIFSVTAHGFILWGTLHGDLLYHPKGGSTEAGGVTIEDIENFERELMVLVE